MPELVKSKDEYRRLVEKYNPGYKNDKELVKDLEREENINAISVEMDKDLEKKNKHKKPDHAIFEEGAIIVMDSAFVND